MLPEASLSPASRAGQAVIAIPELLQNILLQMDIRTALTVATRVCGAWHDMIKNTPSIQRAMFFLPDLESERQTTGDNKQSDKRRRLRQNPLLVEIFPAWFDSSSSECNYLLPAGSSYDTEIEGHRWEPFHKSGVARNRRGFLYPGASWRRMLVTQPPVRALGYMLREYTASSPLSSARSHTCIFDLDIHQREDPDRISKWVNREICSCRLGCIQFDRMGWSPEQVAAMSTAQDHGTAMLDGLRMGTFYDMAQHSSYGLTSQTRWRILWDTKQIEEMLKDPGPDDPVDMFFGPLPTDRCTRLHRGVTVPLLRKLLDEVDGPILQRFSRRRWDIDASAGELEFQLQFRFPVGSGMKYAEYWDTYYADSAENSDNVFHESILGDVMAYDRELEERDELISRGLEPPDVHLPWKKETEKREETLWTRYDRVFV